MSVNADARELRRGSPVWLLGRKFRYHGTRADRDTALIYGPRDVVAREVTWTAIEALRD